MSFHIAFGRVANSAWTMPLVARNRERDMLGFTLSHQTKIRQNMPEVLLQTHRKQFFWFIQALGAIKESNQGRPCSRLLIEANLTSVNMLALSTETSHPPYCTADTDLQINVGG